MAPKVAEIENSLAGVARFIRSDACRNVALLTGAGVSVAAGIPDFRSPTGMYATLPIDKLTASEREKALVRAEPTHVVEKSMFLANPFLYLEVRRPFILGTRERRWKATSAHRFAELLHRHGKLRRVFTQNIDGLDFQTAVPDERIVPVHGSIGAVACEACGRPEPLGAFCDSVRAHIKDVYGVDASAPTESSAIRCPGCGKAALKPTTVLFGASLPERFFTTAQQDLPALDLLIVAGTSLVVAPANSVAAACECPRVIVNDEPVGAELGVECDERAPPTASRRDVFLRGACEDTFRALVAELGWAEELRELERAQGTVDG